MNRLQNDELKEQVRLFAVQEGHHSLQHKLANEALDALGYPATELSQQVAQEIREWEESASDEERLGLTVVLEHVTAVMAHFALTHPETCAGLPQSVQTLIFWHAIEEIEHKAVAFDVYAECVGERGRLRRLLVQQLLLFPYAVAAAQFLIHRRLRHVPSVRDLKRTARFLFGRRGMIVGVMPHYLALLKPNFHPWDIDDSSLVEVWKERLSSSPFDGLTEIKARKSA
jgi:predicted metal-dependent hydrolase